MSAHEVAIHIGSMLGAGLGAFLAQLFQRRQARQLTDVDARQEAEIKRLNARIARLEAKGSNGHG